MGEARYHLSDHPIPVGLQIFDERQEVAGVRYRREDVLAFCRFREPWLEMERDFGNAHDRNAIKIYGCGRSFWGSKRVHIGFVPAELAAHVVEGGWFERLVIRLEKTYVGNDGYVEVGFQLLGPKGRLSDYRPAQAGPITHYLDAVDVVRQLKSAGKANEAIPILLEAIGLTEAEAQECGMGVAPWYYEQLAIIFRQQKRYADEISILERYAAQPKAPGVGPAKLAERLTKARRLAARHGSG